MPRWHPLESSWAKLYRARSHVNDLRNEFEKALRHEDGPIGVETHERERHVVSVVTRIPEFRESALVLGDAVACYRSALDHLVWDLVKLGSHPRLTARQAQSVQFPMATSAKNFDARRSIWAPGVADDRWRIIGLHQPYKRGYAGRAMGVLHRLSNMDKHRYVIPAAVSALGWAGRLTLDGCKVENIVIHPSSRALHVGSQLLAFDVIPVDSGYSYEVDSEITVQPCLHRGVPVLEALEWVSTTVTDVVSRFDALV